MSLQAHAIQPGQTLAGRKAIDILTVRKEGRWTRATVRSVESGKEYTLMLSGQAVTSKCDCPQWKFRGSPLAKKHGLPDGQRWPCPHLTTLYHHADQITREQPATTTLAAVSELVMNRFALIEWQ